MPKYLYMFALALLGISVRLMIENAQWDSWNKGFDWGRTLQHKPEDVLRSSEG